MHRPPWWPENQPWPPPRGRFRRNPFFRRLGCFFGLANLLVLALIVLVVVNIFNLIGQGNFNTLAQWALPIAVVALVVVTAVAVLGMRGIRRISTPLDDLHEAAERVAEGDYSARVTEKGPPEVRSVARAFNDMASRLHQSEEQRRNLLADTTHELLTPLTVIQGNLEGILDGVYPADAATLRGVLDETNMLARLLEDLRTLALAESGALQIKKEPTDLSQFLHEVTSVFQSQAAAGGVTLAVDVDSSLPMVEVDPPRMRQVLSNLLGNSLRYSPAGSEIRLTGTMEAEQLVLAVQDEGPGIAGEDLDHVFERFYKSTDSGGMGLGLAIVKKLVEAHGGQISVENGPTRGSIFRISLPA